MTEMSPLGTVVRLKPHLNECRPDGAARHLAPSQGLPVPGVEMQVIDAEGKEVPWDGETHGRAGGARPLGHRRVLQRPERAPHSFTDDGWFRTGDVVTIDAEGYIEIADRTKDLIKSGGEWISSVALENALMAHPKVAGGGGHRRPGRALGRAPAGVRRACARMRARHSTEAELTEHLAAQFAEVVAAGRRTCSSTSCPRPASASSTRRPCASNIAPSLQLQ